MQYANQLWQADTMYGPYVPNSAGKPVQSRLIAFPDDASRLCCHGQFFLEENAHSLIVFYKNIRMGEARLLDLVANGLLKRCSRNTTGGSK